MKPGHDDPRGSIQLPDFKKIAALGASLFTPVGTRPVARLLAPAPTKVAKGAAQPAPRCRVIHSTPKPTPKPTHEADARSRPRSRRRRDPTETPTPTEAPTPTERAPTPTPPRKRSPVVAAPLYEPPASGRADTRSRVASGTLGERP